MEKNHLILEKQEIFKNFEDKKFFEKNNFEKIINKEIDFRDKREKLDLWDDNDLLRFRTEIPQVEILPGTVEVLSRFLGKEPQRDERGRFRYLLTSGLAVEVITGAIRYHHDIDLVLFDYRNAWWTRYVTDNVTPDRYWAEMKFDPAYLEETSWIAKFQANGAEQTVSTIHPAIILVQKLSNAWGRPPRERDIKDVKELIKFWQEARDGDPSWNAVIQAAITALPQTEQARTKERLAQHYIPKPIPQRPHFDLLARLRFR